MAYGICKSHCWCSKSISNRKCHPILFYHPKKLLYQLYHTNWQHTQHPKILFFPILFKYSNLFFFLLFLFFYSFSSISPITSSTGFNTQSHTHRDPWYTDPPIQTHHHTHTNTGNHYFETNFFILEKPQQKRLRIKIHKFHFLSILPQLSRKPNSSQRRLW